MEDRYGKVEEAVMRRYDDPIDVRRGAAAGGIAVDGLAGAVGQVGADDGRPQQFLWRGRLRMVRAVLAQWVETGSWWTAHEAGSRAHPGADLLAEREPWRAEAGRGAGDQRIGVFELAFSWTDGSWQLVGCMD